MSPIQAFSDVRFAPAVSIPPIFLMSANGDFQRSALLGTAGD